MRHFRVTGFLGLVGASCVLAAGVSAAPAPTSFRLTLIGTAHQEWAYTAPPVQDVGCTRTELTEGIRTATFRTMEPVVVRLVHGRVLPAVVHGITGIVTLGGVNTSEQICGDAGTRDTRNCAQTKRSFARAQVRVVSPRRGVLSVEPIGNVRLVQADCPREPADVRRRPLGPSAGLLRLPNEALMERRLVRMTLRGSRTQKREYVSPEKGHLDERVEWQLTFVRAQG